MMGKKKLLASGNQEAEKNRQNKAKNKLFLPTMLHLPNLHQFPEMLSNYYFTCVSDCGSVDNCLPVKHESGDLNSIPM